MYSNITPTPVLPDSPSTQALSPSSSRIPSARAPGFLTYFSATLVSSFFPTISSLAETRITGRNLSLPSAFGTFFMKRLLLFSVPLVIYTRVTKYLDGTRVASDRSFFTSMTVAIACSLPVHVIRQPTSFFMNQAMRAKSAASLQRELATVLQKRGSISFIRMLYSDFGVKAMPYLLSFSIAISFYDMSRDLLGVSPFHHFIMGTVSSSAAELSSQPVIRLLVKRHIRLVQRDHVRLIQEATAGSSPVQPPKMRFVVPTPSIGRIVIRSAQFGLMVATFDFVTDYFSKNERDLK